MLAEDVGLPRQRQRISVLTARAVARVSAFSHTCSLSPSSQGVIERARWHLPTQWFKREERNHELKESERFMHGTRPACLSPPTLSSVQIFVMRQPTPLSITCAETQSTTENCLPTHSCCISTTSNCRPTNWFEMGCSFYNSCFSSVPR